MTNTLANCGTDLITTVKCFIVKATIEIEAGFIVLLKTFTFKTKKALRNCNICTQGLEPFHLKTLKGVYFIVKVLRPLQKRLTVANALAYYIQSYKVFVH